MITKELLKRYVANECTDQEKAVVERWLDDVKEEESNVASSELSHIKSDMWKEILTVLPEEKEIRVIPFHKRFIPISYAAAASLLIGTLFICLVFFAREKFSAGIKESGYLEVASAGKIVKVDSDHCVISFSGYIQLINTSSKIKTIVCEEGGGKTFHLEPGEVYYLEKLNGVPYLIREKEISHWEDFNRYVKGNFSIHFKKV